MRFLLEYVRPRTGPLIVECPSWEQSMVAMREHEIRDPPDAEGTRVFLTDRLEGLKWELVPNKPKGNT